MYQPLFFEILEVFSSVFILSSLRLQDHGGGVYLKTNKFIHHIKHIRPERHYSFIFQQKDLGSIGQ